MEGLSSRGLLVVAIPKSIKSRRLCVRVRLTNYHLDLPASASASSSSSVVVNNNNNNNNNNKLDKSGRFCSPRAGRELAMSMVYASCLQGCDPLQVFEKRVNLRVDDEFNLDLSQFDHMNFAGPPLTVHSVEDQNKLLLEDQSQSTLEAQVLAAPPKLVYNNFILRFTRKLLVAVTQRWDTNVLLIHKVIPPRWKDEAAGRILELSILHLAMSEISVVGTPHQVVVNEAVDLSKRFCDGAAPRTINACLRTFLYHHFQQP